MHAQLITYKLKGVTKEEYQRRMVQPDAPLLAAVKGLHSKVWLSNEAENAYGGFYLWESKADMDQFMGSDMVKAVVSRPFVTDVHSVDYSVPQEASVITRGVKATA